MHSTILTGAKIGRGSIIAAGALVLQNQVIPPNSLVVGVPAKVIKTINKMDNIHAQALKYKCEWAIGYGVKPDIDGELYHNESYCLTGSDWTGSRFINDKKDGNAENALPSFCFPLFYRLCGRQMI